MGGDTVTRQGMFPVGGAVDEQSGFPLCPIPSVNVSTMPHRSPLRYPGGKTWLIPHIRAWCTIQGSPDHLFVEPFAGGATASLTAIAEVLAARVLMVERDPDVAAVWRAALTEARALQSLIIDFEMDAAHITSLVASSPTDPVRRALRTIVLNRARRGGVIADGAGLLKFGDGRGVASRWYPEALAERVGAIGDLANRITFVEGDGMEVLANPPEGPHIVFVDPPYPGAGQRLYAYSDVEPAAVFGILSEVDSDFLLTYNATDEICHLVRRHDFAASVVVMRNTHHHDTRELLITRHPLFTPDVLASPPG